MKRHRKRKYYYFPAHKRIMIARRDIFLRINKKLIYFAGSTIVTIVIGVALK